MNYTNYTPEELAKALSELEEKYPDIKVNNNKSIGTSPDNEYTFQNKTYIQQSMKRSSFKNFTYKQCKFKNIAFTGSIFHSINFINCNLYGNSFACCNFYNSKFNGKKSKFYKANNFSQSNFTGCEFYASTFHSSSFLQTLFHKCKIEKTRFRSSTMEGTRFVNCHLSHSDFGNVNVEFVEFIHTTLEKVVFPFYQFPYIIGIADYIGKPLENIALRTGKQLVHMNEYLQQIDNLILYYLDQFDFFPVCNLYIFKNDISSATQTLLDGINNALHDLDFRMIRHFCRLALHHNLLNEITRRRISKTIEDYISKNDIPPEQLNDCNIHIGEIKKILLSGNNTSVTLNLNIRTNICKKNQQGMEYVNSLCNNLNTALSQNDWGQSGFQVAVSNHSPYEIAVEVICTVASVATIAQFVWQIIDKHQENKLSLKGYTQVDEEIYHNYINTRIDLCKEQLLKLKDSYSTKKMHKYIEEITQNLKTDLDALYEKDIMIFKKENDLPK